MKYLLWLILAAVIVLWLLNNKKSRIKSASPPRQAEHGAEAILQCASCGVHIPKSEAVSTTDGVVFCSEEHRLRHSAS